MNMSIFKASDIKRELTDKLRQDLNSKMLDCFNSGNGSFYITSVGNYLLGHEDYEQYNTNLSSELLRTLGDELRVAGYYIEEVFYKTLWLEVTVDQGVGTYS